MPHHGIQGQRTKDRGQRKLAVERKAPSSPVLCLLSSVVCQITAPATLNSEPIPLLNWPLATLVLATLPHWQHFHIGNTPPDTEAVLRQLLFVICEQLCQLRFVNNHKNQSQKTDVARAPSPLLQGRGGLATSWNSRTKDKRQRTEDGGC